MNATGKKNAGPTVEFLSVPLDYLAGATLLALVALTCADVIGRELFNAPVFGAVELTRLALPLIVFASLPLVSYKEEHISVDLMDMFFPERAINARQFVLNLILVPIMAIVAWQLWILGSDWLEYNELTEDLRIPKYVMAYFISIMCGITSLLLAFNLLRYIRGRGPMSPKRKAK